MNNIEYTHCARTRTRTRTHVHVHTHTYTHTYTILYIHTYIQQKGLLLVLVLLKLFFFKKLPLFFHKKKRQDEKRKCVCLSVCVFCSGPFCYNVYIKQRGTGIGGVEKIKKEPVASKVVDDIPFDVDGWMD